MYNCSIGLMTSPKGGPTLKRIYAESTKYLRIYNMLTELFSLINCCFLCFPYGAFLETISQIKPKTQS